MAAETKRGGAREGAGRKAEDGVTQTKRVNVSLDSGTLEKAEKIGDGNVSVGIRRAVKKFKLIGESK
jgi:hypothetical protein